MQKHLQNSTCKECNNLTLKSFRDKNKDMKHNANNYNPTLQLTHAKQIFKLPKCHS